MSAELWKMRLHLALTQNWWGTEEQYVRGTTMQCRERTY